jgi:hypothetical protein
MNMLAAATLNKATCAIHLIFSFLQPQSWLAVSEFYLLHAVTEEKLQAKSSLFCGKPNNVFCCQHFLIIVRWRRGVR